MFDYLAIGHVTHDVLPSGELVVGGTVTFAARTAISLGQETAVLTSASADFTGQERLAGVTVHTVPATYTTTFRNLYVGEARQQQIGPVAHPLTALDLPSSWGDSHIVHFAPVAQEIGLDLLHAVPDHVCKGMTIQGWLRGWDESGQVTAVTWAAAAAVLPLADVIIFSEEDLAEPGLLTSYRQYAPLMVVTQGSHGCTVFQGETATHFPAVPVTAVDLTGAGDIFAAAYLVHYHQTSNPFTAAQFANQVAAFAVTQPDFQTKVTAYQRK